MGREKKYMLKENTPQGHHWVTLISSATCLIWSVATRCYTYSIWLMKVLLSPKPQPFPFSDSWLLDNEYKMKRRYDHFEFMWWSVLGSGLRFVNDSWVSLDSLKGPNENSPAIVLRAFIIPSCRCKQVEQRNVGTAKTASSVFLIDTERVSREREGGWKGNITLSFHTDADRKIHPLIHRED